MISQLATKQNPNFNKLLSEQHISAIRSHPDVNILPFIELDYNHLKYYLLLPNFLNNFEIFVQDITFDCNVSLNDKIRLIGLLTSVRVFYAKTRWQFDSIIKSCFDILLYLRFSENMVASSLSKNDQDQNKFDPTEMPIFRDFDHDLINPILFLMNV